CSRLAGITLDRIADVCYRLSGSTNMYTEQGKKSFLEIGRENRDGAITGTVYNIMDDGLAKKAGGFRIERDGSVSRGPRWMKTIRHLRLEIDGVCFGQWQENWGEPTEESLFQQVKEYADSLKVGGLNYHISKAKGYIPYPVTAKVVRLEGPVVEWKAAAFQVW